MMNQQERLEDYKANADQTEMEANARLHAEAIELLKKGFCPRFVANKTFISIKVINELKEKLGL